MSSCSSLTINGRLCRNANTAAGSRITALSIAAVAQLVKSEGWFCRSFIRSTQQKATQ